MILQIPRSINMVGLLLCLKLRRIVGKKSKIKINLYDNESGSYLRIDIYQTNDRLYLGLEIKDSFIAVNLSG